MRQKTWVSMMRVLLCIGLVILPLVLTVPLMKCSEILWSHSMDDLCAVAVSENGEYVAVGCEDGYYYIFDSWGKVVGEGHVPAPVVSLDIATTGDCIIGSETGFTLCNNQGEHISSFVSFHVQSVSISDSGVYSLACSQENLYINQSASMILQLQISGKTPFGSISGDGSTACATSDGVLHVFKDGSFMEPIKLHDPVNDIFISNNGKSIILALDDKVGIMDHSGEIEYMHMNAPITSMSASPDTKTCVITSLNTITWLEDGKVVFEKVSDASPRVLDGSEDGSLAVLTHGQQGITIITQIGDTLLTREFPSRVLDAYWAGDSVIVYTGDGVSCLRLYKGTKENTNFFPVFSRKSLPLHPQIDELWSFPVDDGATFVTGDPDGDGHTEIIVREGSTVTLIDETGALEGQRDLEIPFSLYSPMDVDGDMVPEIPLIFRHSIYTFTIYDWQDDRLQDYFFYHIRDDPSQTGQARPFMILTNEDNESLILASLSAGYSCKLRGVIAVSQESGDMLWMHQIGPGVLPDIVDDIDGDGTWDIIIGSAAPCNCSDDEQYPDCEASIIALSMEGEEKWNVSVGTGYKRVSVMSADVLESPGKEIIGFCYEASENWGRLLCLSNMGDILYDVHHDYSVFPGAVGDMDEDGNREIITLDSRGYLTLYTPQLKEIQKVYIDENLTSNAHLRVTDMDGDGTCDIVFWHDTTLRIFNRELAVLWENQYDAAIRAEIISGRGCKNILVVLSDNLYAYAFEGPKVFSCPLWEIEFRKLSEKARTYEKEAQSLLSSKKYWNAREKFTHAREIYAQLHDEQKVQALALNIDTISHVLFREGVKTGIWLLSMVSGITVLVLCYFLIFEHRWHQSCEYLLLISIPNLFGLSWMYVEPTYSYLSSFVESAVPLLILSSAILLRQSILGFVRTISAYIRGHRDMLVLSITTSNAEYHVSVESIGEKFEPVKESQKITILPSEKRHLVEKVAFMMDVLSQASTEGPEFYTYAQNMLQDVGKTLYERFIPQHLAHILTTRFLLLEVQDTEIPWELLFSHEFFALQYAISRRIVATESVTVRHPPVHREKRALIISDPQDNLPGAKTECKIVHERLHKKMDTVLVEGNAATVGRVAHLLGQGFDIIHFAGHIENGLALADGYVGFEEVKEFLVGTPIVCINGCKSEELTKAFLLGGAKVYVGTVHPIHDRTAAEIAADFYDLCFQYQIGEALRRARVLHKMSSITWASLIMYGDPTFTLW